MLRHACIALALVTTPLLTAAAQNAPLTAEQVIERAVVITDENGVETTVFVPAEKIAPGEELRYRLVYSNSGAELAEDIRLVMPIPAEVTFIEGSVEAGPAQVSFSADRGASFGPREDAMITEAGEPRAASAEDLTHIEWVFADGIAPGSTGDISFRAVLK